MATSLKEQLQNLRAPQSAIHKDSLKKSSLLFDSKEAALKDRDTFYEIGLSGLRELIALYEGFRFYEDTLYSVASKDFERAVQSKETNQNLDQTIEKFLLQLSPYLLLQSAHKALEWLVNRYHIHQYNQDAIMALILPYHETKIFVRFIQLMNLKSNSNRWHWLKPLQKTGITLAKQVLFNHCASSTATLHFIAKTTLKYVKEYGERATQLNTVFAFFCSTAVGTIDTSKKVTEAIINALLPTVMKALESPVVDFRSSAYIILGYLSTKASIKNNTFNDIVEGILSVEFDLSYDMTLLINLLYSHQTHITKMPEAILCNMSNSFISSLCVYLKKLVEAKINIQQFTLIFMRSILTVIQSDSEEFMKYCQLPEILVDEVDFKTQNPEAIIKAVLDSLKIDNTIKIQDGDESDIEIIDEDEFSAKIIEWFSKLLKKIENQYPEAFDKVVKDVMSSDSRAEAKKQAQLSKVLGFKPAVAHKLGGSYLFENLNHINPKLRVEAVNYIAKEFDALKIENDGFVRSSIINRLEDDNPEVVSAVLIISTKNLYNVLNEDDLTISFVNLVSKSSVKWQSVVKNAFEKFCSLDSLPVNHETVMAIMPYLYCFNENSVEIAQNIVKSTWGKKFDLTKDIPSKALKSKDVLLNELFKRLFTKRSLKFDNVLDVTKLNRDNILNINIYLLLKSCSFKEATIEDITETLSLILESVENRNIVKSSDGKKFSPALLPEFVQLSQKNYIVFEVMEYIFSKIIEDMNIKSINKPWCNMCQTPETVLVRRLYEICVTGCAISSYEENYSNLLQLLLGKFCSGHKEKFEFIANFACGHILYANDPKDVISPELQLRSLKLIGSYLSIESAEKTWIYESDVFILTILYDLSNPIALIRQFVIDLMSQVLKNVPGKNQTYFIFLKELLDYQEELVLDNEQISQVICNILTASSPEKKIFRRNCLLKLLGILMSGTPAHITSEFLKIFSLNNANAFSNIVPCLNSFEEVLSSNQLNKKFVLDIYESKLFRNVYGRINENTVSTFSKDQIWKSIEIGLREYREVILQEDQTIVSPCILIMKQIDEDVYKKIPQERLKDFFYLICCAGAFSDNASIASAASKLMKRVHINFAEFKPILQKMISVEDPAANVSKKKKTSHSMLSYQLAECDEWKLGVSLLEYVQSKKKMTVDNSFVSILFQVLSKCLRFEEQSHVEYTKQLVLSSIWYYCKKFVDDKDSNQIKSLKALFDIESVVQCIRGTQNPQTHHHALILLCHAAFMLPEQVLHHTMEIFTFMGSSVLRHDDAYSFQIIVKIIENLVPILVKLEKDTVEYTDKELQQLQNRVVPVLRIFADVVLHVPEHRRLPLYKKLLETLGPRHFLWTFLALLLDTHIVHFNENKEKEKQKHKTLAEKESPANRLDFGQSILLEFPPEVGLENLIKLITFVKSLPLQKDEDAMETNINPTEIFSVNGHTPNQLRHYKYVIITFMNSCLSSSRFIQHSNQVTNQQIIEGHYKSFIISVLTFIQSITKVHDDKSAKYWRVMLYHSYNLLDNINNLLSAPMFLSVIRGLLKHTLQPVRRKSMELLNSKIQFSPEMFKLVDKDSMYSLLPPLLDIVKTIDNGNRIHEVSETNEQELELNQQTALLSLKLLTRMLATENPEPFKPVLETVTEYTCNPKISGNVMASIVLCLAELCSNLKAHALVSLRKFMPALITVLKKQRKAETPELVLLSTVTAISKIIESLPLFLSPYLQKILYEHSMLLAKWQNCDQECSKVSAIVSKLSNIQKKISESIPPRVLIPVANETYLLLLEKENFDAIRPVMSVLAESFVNVTTADFNALQQNLVDFFLTALQLRSDAAEKNIDVDRIDKAEDEIVKAFVSLILKLSETSFRPFYFKIYDWAIRTNAEGHKDRAITFYRLSSAIAEKLKGLFVLFAGHFIKNAADLLDSCSASKSEEHYFDSDEKCITLVSYVIKTLHIVFLYDSQNFVNKERFETLMQPVVDQLENTMGGMECLKARATELIIPCIAQLAVAIGDDSLWKLLNYQVLLKTRHNDADIRLIALDCLVAMATQLGSSWLPLLAESVPFLAELLEDGDSRIETATKEAIRKLEQILEEPLEKYF